MPQQNRLPACSPPAVKAHIPQLRAVSCVTPTCHYSITETIRALHPARSVQAASYLHPVDPPDFTCEKTTATALRVSSTTTLIAELTFDDHRRWHKRRKRNTLHPRRLRGPEVCIRSAGNSHANKHTMPTHHRHPQEHQLLPERSIRTADLPDVRTTIAVDRKRGRWRAKRQTAHG